MLFNLDLEWTSFPNTLWSFCCGFLFNMYLWHHSSIPLTISQPLLLKHCAILPQPDLSLPLAFSWFLNIILSKCLFPIDTKYFLKWFLKSSHYLRVFKLNPCATKSNFTLIKLMSYKIEVTARVHSICTLICKLFKEYLTTPGMRRSVHTGWRNERMNEWQVITTTIWGTCDILKQFIIYSLEIWVWILPGMRDRTHL